MLTITGEILKEGAYYAAMLEQLGAYAQGKTRAAARQALASTILAHASDVGLTDGSRSRSQMMARRRCTSRRRIRRG